MNPWYRGVIALIVHFVFSEIGILFAIPHGFASSIWPAAGISLGLYLAWGWPVIIGAFLGYLLAMWDVNLPVLEQSFLVPSLFALAACIQFVVAKLLLQYLVSLPIIISSLLPSLKFLLVIGPISCLCASTLATITLTYFNDFSATEIFFTWAVWWVGDFTGVLFFTPIVLCLLKNDYVTAPKQAKSLVAISAVLFVVIALLFSFSREKYHNEKQLEFDKLSQSFVQELNRAENTVEQQLRALKGLFDASDQVTREDFERFAREINTGNVKLRAMAWLPRVPASKLPNLERAARASGIRDFSVRLVTPSAVEPAQGKEVYFPIYYTEPLEQNYQALGIDVYHHPIAGPSVKKAIETGQPALTSLLALAQEKEKATGIIAYYPVYEVMNRQQRAEVIGVVEVVFELDIMLEDLHRNEYKTGFSFTSILDNDDKNQIQIGVANQNSLFNRLETLSFFDRSLTIEFASTSQYEKRFVDWTSWIVIIGGSIIGVVTIAFIYSLMSFHDALSMQVDFKTKALTDANKQLIEANQSKSLFLANMSHELRTPLNGVIGTLQLIDSAVMDDESRDLVNQGLVSSKTLLTVINDILDISKIEAGKVNIEYLPTDVSNLFAVTVESMRVRADDAKLQLNLEIDEGFHSSWKLDPTRVKQILLNLLSNAIKFTADGEVRVKVWQQQNQVCFSVTDTGVGMTAQELKAIFQRFEQADKSTTRKYGGTGLGMAITKQLLDLMDGEIKVNSEKDQGTEFTVMIPLERCAPQVVSKEGSAHYAPPDLVGKKILLAEDNPINQKIFLSMLNKTQAECLVANDGEEAVSLFNQNVPDMVFLDIQMPNMDGVEACKLIREKNKQVPIIAVTANVFKEDVNRYLANGFTAHIAKPIDINHLYRELARFKG